MKAFLPEGILKLDNRYTGVREGRHVLHFICEMNEKMNEMWKTSRRAKG